MIMSRGTVLSFVLVGAALGQALAQDTPAPSSSSTRRVSAVPGVVFAKEPGPVPKGQDRAKAVGYVRWQPLALDSSDPGWGQSGPNRRRFQNDSPARTPARFDAGPHGRETQYRALGLAAYRDAMGQNNGPTMGRNPIFFGFPIDNGLGGAPGQAAGASPFVFMGVR